MVRIVTDSTADLSPALVGRYDIAVVPLSVVHQGNSYRDGIDMDGAALLDTVSRTGMLPTTAAPAMADFMAAFSGADQALYVGISSQFSSSLQHARLAAAECDGARIVVVDSLNLSTGIGLLAIKAAEWRDEGLGVDEIGLRLRAAVPKVHTAFVIETTEYLYKGGRCSALQNIVGSLLHIRPIIGVEPDGTMGVRAKIHGSRKKALDYLLADLEQHRAVLDPARVFVTHSGCDADAEALARAVEDMVHPREVLITRAGCVVTSHCGPDTIGILYMER
jgi:DegV family protein with EDD domain